MEKWVVFTERKTKRSIPKVSIRKQGTFGISKNLYEEYLKDVDDVELLFNIEDNQIGIRPISEPAKHSYKVRKKGQNTVEISGMAFLEHYGIPHEETIQYEAFWQEPGFIIVDLNKKLKEFN